MRKHVFSPRLIPHSIQQKQQGYIFITVIITLFILASITVLLNRESSMAVNMTASESRITKARYVAEAGLNHALWQANNANCTGYPSSVTNSFGSNSYTVSVSPSSGSPVSITASGTLSSGESTSISRSNLMIYQDPTIMVLQPDPTTGKDGYIEENKPTFNYGAISNLHVSSTVNERRNSLLQFDFSTLPTNAEIIDAKLELNVNNVSFASTTINVHRLTKDWHEDNNNWTDADTSITWATSGGDFDSTISASAITPASTGWTNWNITTLVNNWVNGSVANYGLMLRAIGVDNATRFDSSDSVNNRPKLTITYSCECGASCSAAATICNGTFRDEFSNRDFNGTNGTLDWSNNPWLEVGESDGETTGDIQIINDVSNYQLRTRDNDNGGEGVEREIDLTGATTATLEYEYRREGLDDSNDYTTVEISANGTAGPWVELARYQGSDGGGGGGGGGMGGGGMGGGGFGTTDASYTLIPAIDISTYISSNTRIRLKTSADMGGSDVVWFDSVEIQCSP